MSEIVLPGEIVTAGALMVMALIVLALWLFRKTSYRQLESVIETAVAPLPDVIEPLAFELIMRAVGPAYEAVEQWSDAYGHKTNDERLAQAKQWVSDIYEFLRSGNLTSGAAVAFIEAEIFNRHANVPAASRVPVKVSQGGITHTPESGPVGGDATK